MPLRLVLLFLFAAACLFGGEVGREVVLLWELFGEGGIEDCEGVYFVFWEYRGGEVELVVLAFVFVVFGVELGFEWVCFGVSSWR
jgi:hypothetical protein